MFEETTRPKASYSLGIDTMLYEETIVHMDSCYCEGDGNVQ